MPGWVNFQDIRKRVSIEDVLLKYYRLDNLKRDGNKLTGPCPVHQGKNPRSFHVDTEKNLWHCFTKCQGGGNQLDLVAKKEDISIREAALKLQAFFLGSESRQPHISPREGKKEPTSAKPEKEDEPKHSDDDDAANPPLNVVLDLKGDHPYLTDNRGLSTEVTRHFGIGYCSRGILRGMIAIPIHDEEGILIAYAGRRLKAVDIAEFGKYKFPKGYRKELVLYNLNRAKSYQKEQGLILVEGFFSVAKLHAFGFPNVVASMGCELSDSQARLMSEAKEVIILFDGDEAGYKGALHAKEKISKYVPVRIVKLPEKTEPEDFSPKALRWLINGISSLDLAEVSFLARTVPTASAAPAP